MELKRHPGLGMIMIGLIMILGAVAVYTVRAGVVYALAYLGLGFFGLAMIMAGIAVLLLRKTP